MDDICKETTAHILADEAICKIFGSPLTVKPSTRTTCKQSDGIIASHYVTLLVEGPETMGIASVNATQDGVTDIEMHIDDRTVKIALSSDVQASFNASASDDIDVEHPVGGQEELTDDESVQDESSRDDTEDDASEEDKLAVLEVVTGENDFERNSLTPTCA